MALGLKQNNGFFSQLSTSSIGKFISLKLDFIIPQLIAYIIFIWAIVGFYFLFKYIFTIINTIYARLLRPCKNLPKSFGSWAVVTGCTDGIGEAMAIELARKKMNLVLISRDLAKLNDTKERIEKKYAVECRVLVVDFSDFNASVRAAVTEALSQLDVGVLINNVGMSYPFTKYFHELSDVDVERLISLNIDSTTWMTKIVLPLMTTKKKGAIVNISSAAGVTVSPLLSQYSAAKSYVMMYSKALSSELSDFNIHVQVQVPLYVATKLAKIKRTSLFVPSPQAYARAAVACIGYDSVISPYWSHAAQLWIMSFIPLWQVEAWIVKWMNYGVRKAGMKKEQARAREALVAAPTSSESEVVNKDKKKA